MQSVNIMLIVFIAGIIIMIYSAVTYSMVGLVIGGIITFIGAFYVFDLYKLQSFKTVKTVFDLIVAPFTNS